MVHTTDKGPVYYSIKAWSGLISVATSTIIVAAPRGRAWVHLNNRESGDFLWAYYTIIFTSSWKMGSDLGLVIPAGVGSAVEKYKGNLNFLVVDGWRWSAAPTMGC